MRKEAKRKRRMEAKKRASEGGDGDSPRKKRELARARTIRKGRMAKKGDAPVEYTKGLVLKVSGVPAGTTLYQIKDAFKAIGDVKFV